MLKKFKVAFLLVMALVLMLQGMPVAQAQTIDKLTLDYVMDSLGDALNYGTVARLWDQNAHAESSACVDYIIKHSEDPFANSVNTYAHAVNYTIEATITAPAPGVMQDGLRGMTFALFKEKGDSFELVAGTEKTIPNRTGTATLSWTVSTELKNTRLYVMQVKDGTYVKNGATNAAGMAVTYGPSVSAHAQNDNYIGKIVYPKAIAEGSQFKIFNMYDNSPSVTFGPETRIYYKQNNKYIEIPKGDTGFYGQVYVNYFYPKDGNLDGLMTNNTANLEMGYADLDGCAYVNGHLVRNGNQTVYVYYRDKEMYASSLLKDAKAFSKWLGNQGGGVINPETGIVPNDKGSSTVHGPVAADGTVVSLYDVEIGADKVFSIPSDMGYSALPVADQEYAIVNLIAPSKDCTISLAPKADDSKYSFYRNGHLVQEGTGWGAGATDGSTSQRIIYNVVYMDENGVMQPFEGTIIPHSKLGGTILAPAAKMELTTEVHNGALIVDYVHNKQEIHQRTLMQSNRTTWVAMNAGYITLEKTSVGYHWSTGIMDPSRWEIMTEGISLEGAVFGIYNKAGCGPADLVTTVTTDAEGKATSGALAAGKYWVKEITPLKDHNLSTEVIAVTVENGKPVQAKGGNFVKDGSYVMTDNKIVNEQNSGTFSLRLEKVTDSGKPLQGAVFGIYDTCDSKGKLHGLVGTMTTNRNGVAIYEGLTLQLHNDDKAYYIQEISAPEGYKISGDGYVTVNMTSDMRDKMITIGADGKINASPNTPFVNKEQVSLQGKKIWNDSGNAPDKRPRDVSITIYRSIEGDAETALDPQPKITWSNKNTDVWNWESAYLDKYDANGNEYIYTVKENNVPNGYVSTVDGLDITNSYPGNIFLYKVHRNNAEGKNEVLNGAKFRIYYDAECDKPVDNKEYETKYYSSTRNGFVEFPNLIPGVYYILETEAPEGFALPKPNMPIRVEVIAGKNNRVNDHLGGDDRVVVNYPESKSVVVYVSKQWLGDEGHEDKRVEIEVQLMRNNQPVEGKTLVLNEANGWQGSFGGLEEKDANNQNYRYDVKELTQVEGYLSSEKGSQNVFTLVNTYNLTSIPVIKDWVGVPDGKALPESITVQLYGVNNAAVEGKTLVLSAENNWSGVFEDLPVRNPYNLGDTNPINYFVKEVSAPDGYITNVLKQNDGSYMVINTYNMVDIPVVKRWEKVDANATLPAVTVQLYIGNNAVEGKTLVLSAENNWGGVFENLPARDPQNPQNKYEYTVRETGVSEQDYHITYAGSAENGFTITNTAVGGKIKLHKVDASNNNSGLGNAVFGIYSDLECTQEVATMTTDHNGNALSGELMPATYYVKEKQAPSGEYRLNTHVATVNVTGKDTYTAVGDAANGDFTNMKYGKVSLRKVGAKVARPGHNEVDESTVRPLEGAKFIISKDQNFDPATDMVIATNEDGYLEAELPYGEYYIKELEAPEGYEIVWTGTKQFQIRSSQTLNLELGEWFHRYDGKNQALKGAVLNNLVGEVEMGSITLTKVDADSSTKLPGAVFGVYSTSGTLLYTMPPTDANGVSTLENVAVGTYYVQEITAPGGYVLDTTKYENVVVTAGATATVNNGDAIPNTKQPEVEYVSISVQKVWSGAEANQQQPVTVQLLQNGFPVQGKAIQLSQNNQWQFSFTDLPKLDANGTPYTYTVQEVTVPGFDTAITGDMTTGFTITNTKQQVVENISISVRKEWNGVNENEKQNITVNLMNGGTVVSSVTLPQNGQWSYTFENLPKKDANGQDINYTVQEINVPAGFTVSYGGDAQNGFTITNKKIENASATLQVAKAFYNNSDASSPAKTFTFTLTEHPENDTTGYTMPETSTAQAVFVAGEKGEKPVTFGDFTFTKPGDYIFYVEETADAQVVQAVKKYALVYQVTPEGGQLVIDSYFTEDLESDSKNDLDMFAPRFENYYVQAKSGLELSKFYPGSEEETFRFTMTPVNEKGDAAGESESIELALDAGSQEKSIEIGKTYYLDDAGKTFYYKLQEIPGANEKIKYDESTWWIRERVVLENNYLSVYTDAAQSETFPGEEKWVANAYVASFRNDVVVEDVTVQLLAAKQVEGKENATDKFTFQLSDADGNVVETVNAAAGEVEFTELTFSLDFLMAHQDALIFDQENAKAMLPLTYTISEAKGSNAAYTYDETEYTAVVTLTLDAMTYEYTATVEYCKGEEKLAQGEVPTFVNTYEAEAGAGTLQVKKAFCNWSGEESPAKTFTFTLTEERENDKTGYTMPENTTAEVKFAAGEIEVGQSKEGRATFGAITFTKAGEYGFYVTEAADEDLVQRFDGYYVHYSVKETDGKLVATATYAENKEQWAEEHHMDLLEPLYFENYYMEAYAFIGLEKEYEGDRNETFTFTLQSVNENGETTGETAETLSVDAGAEDMRDEVRLTYPKEDLGKTYYYLLTENPGTNACIDYDESKWWVRVKVTGNLDFNADVGIHLGTEISMVKADSLPTTELDWVTGENVAIFVNEELISVPVEKVWEGGESETVKEITVKLLANGTEKESTKLTSDNGWKATFENLPKYDEEGEITYTVEEVEVEGYVSSVEGDTENGFTITNKKIQGTEAELTVSKTVEINGAEKINDTVTIKIEPVTEGAPAPSKTELALTITEAGTQSETVKYAFEKAGVYRYDVYEANKTNPTCTYDDMMYTVEFNVVLNEATGEHTVTTTVYDYNGAKVNTTGAVSFTNTYEYTSVSVEKVWEGGESETVSEITMKLLANGEEAESVTLTAADGWKATFENLPKNNEDGEITYTVEEVEVEGYVSSVEGDAENGFTITNKKINDAKLTLAATKSLDGADLESGKFTFLLLDADKKAMKDARGNDITTTNNSNGMVFFNDVVFTMDAFKGEALSKTQPTTKEITLYMVEVDGKAPGFTYDTEPKAVTVTLTFDPATGTLSAESSSTGDNMVEFKNSYTQADGSVRLEATKKMNVAMTAGQFTFRLLDAEKNPVKGADGKEITATNDALGNVVFPALNYTLADLDDVQPDQDGKKRKELIYYVAEQAGDNPGITYDTKEYPVQVVLSYNADEHKLTAEPAYLSEDGSAPVITNTYEAEGEITFTGEKELKGRVLEANEFSFELYEGETKLETVKNAADGSITFSTIDYDLDDVGTHTYTVKEVVGDSDTIIYDEAIYTVTVEVTDAGSGALEAEVTEVKKDGETVANGTITFENKYAYGYTSISGVKKMKNRSFKPGDSFTFELWEKDGTEPVETTTITPTAGGTNGFGFGMSFTKENIGETYTYYVKEQLPAGAVDGKLNGVTYDGTVYTVTIEVGTAADGTLEVKRTYLLDGEETDSIFFTNTYEAAATDVNLGVKKKLENAKKLAEGRTETFKFQLKKDGTTVDTVEISLSKAEDAKSATFGKLSFDKAGTYMYTVVEETVTADGISGDTAEYTVTVEVVDDLNGQLQATYVISKGGEKAEEIAFVNIYTHETTSVKVTKEWVETEAQKALRPASVKVQLYADGEKVDGQVVTLSEGNGWTDSFTGLDKYRYNTETKANEEITYTVKEVTTDEQGNTLEWVGNYDIGEATGTAESGYTIKNTCTYDANGQLLLTGTKTVEGDATTADYTFSFEVYEGETLVSTGKSDAEGKIAFEPVSYTLEQAGQYEYTVKEVASSAVDTTKYSVVYDATEYKVLVTVADGGQGVLNVTWTLDGEAEEIAFTNKVTMNVGNIGVMKVDSRDTTKGLAGAEFFVYSDAECAVKKGVIITGESGAGIMTDLPVGTYYVKENKAPEGYAADTDKVYTVTVVKNDTAMVNGTYVTNDKLASLQLEKSDKLNPDKKLAGAVYTLYTDESCLPEHKYADITTGENGVGTLENVPAGTYWVKETQAPVGYEIDPQPYKVVVEADADPEQPVFVPVSDYPLRGALALSKTVVASAQAEESFLFDIELTGSADPVAGSYEATLNGVATEAMAFTATETGAKATVSLKDGQTLVIRGLRAGVTYTVTEQLNARYDVEVNGAKASAATGAISETAVSIVKFQNTLKQTGFTVEKVWQGEDAGEIKLTLYANGVAMDPQPTVSKTGNTYTYADLALTDAEGKEIVYTVKETAMAGYTTTYVNVAPYAEKTDCAYNGGKIINQALTSFSVKKEWSGLAQGEKAPAIQLTLYCNGTVYTASTPAPDANGYYTYNNLPATVDGKAAVYTVKETEVTGYTTTYVNKGENASVTDCAYNGGTIVNTKIPQTGDGTPLALWMLMTMLAGCGLAGVTAVLRKREN